jgi:hypothetical protein
MLEAVSKVKVRNAWQAMSPALPGNEETLSHHHFLLNPLSPFGPLRPIGPCRPVAAIRCRRGAEQANSVALKPEIRLEHQVQKEVNR